MMQTLSDWLGIAQGWLFETVVQPLVFQLGLGEFVEDAFEGTEWLLIGVLELALLFLVLRPLEAMLPAQQITDPRARWNDFLYTLLHRVGVFSVLIFFTLDPLMDGVAAALRFDGFHPFNLEALWPGISPLGAFFVYFVVLDFFDYWYHRSSHKFNWWWGLHGLHHSQQNLNLWSDNRNHILDDLLRDVYMGVIALCIGVEPAQYVILVSVSRILQSLQHANVRLHFGWLGERLLVSPRYHRMHHAIGVGHENHDGKLGGCNFAVLLPVWDMVFRTANFRPEFVATGIRDQLPGTGADGVVMPGRDYGRGFWAQQWLGLKRMVEYARKEVV
ncbi:Sterol desaturase/sphingolipid hydroxylase, fatty acid hydroxylase superfamily [Duganella sacchari]|uniref:Sterol desaturase/sphingolipid hydroxylase, fatty acid hydroxylase superfamily n=1 Tax=Duganella sacchari TaxID=551987 RepID=A0A1M7PJJ4_9BURK|nr:sterol desaturase family protein [Duganella sacchari]SHN17240.1 Sterol desaturase/sphingolipid hydroxylase, fatty acid hydroxylase superfamily [Duganella sacchari]